MKSYANATNNCNGMIVINYKLVGKITNHGYLDVIHYLKKIDMKLILLFAVILLFNFGNLFGQNILIVEDESDTSFVYSSVFNEHLQQSYFFINAIKDNEKLKYIENNGLDSIWKQEHKDFLNNYDSIRNILRTFEPNDTSVFFSYLNPDGSFMRTTHFVIKYHDKSTQFKFTIELLFYTNSKNELLAWEPKFEYLPISELEKDLMNGKFDDMFPKNEKDE